MKILNNKAELSKITKHTVISDLLAKHPKTAEILVDYGLHCVGCPLSGMDSIENGAKLHGLSDESITEMVDRVNEAIKYKE